MTAVTYMGDTGVDDAPVDGDDYNAWRDAMISWLLRRNHDKTRIVAHACQGEYGARTYFVLDVTGHTARATVIPPFAGAYTLHFVQGWIREE